MRMALDTTAAHIDLVLLATLSSGPMHGYAIAAHLTENGLPVGEADLYPALHRLEERGHIASTWTDTGGRRRRMYQLGSGGRVALDEARRAWAGYSTSVERIIEGAQWAITP